MLPPLKTPQTPHCVPPYRPFRGAQPPHFVDRYDAADLGFTSMTAAALAAWARGPASPRFHQLVTAPPGMGKTALLRELCRQAEFRLGWAALLHSCRPKERVLGTLAAEVVATIERSWSGETAEIANEILMPRLRSASAEAPATLWPKLTACSPTPVPSAMEPRDEQPWAALKSVMELAGAFAIRRRRGVLVALDDADLLGAGELEAIGHLGRALSRQGLPVALVFSGGTDLDRRFSRSGNFFGDVWPTELCLFDEAETREALVVPATDRGVDFEEDALEMLCAASGGSPLETQRLGFSIWLSAQKEGIVRSEHVRGALAKHPALIVAQAS